MTLANIPEQLSAARLEPRRAPRSNPRPRRTHVATLMGAAMLALMFLWPQSASAEAFLRVIAQRAPIHSGPGPNYRQMYSAERGQIFTVMERGTKGYWFRVKLDDGTSGWIFGELVFPFEVVDKDDPGIFRRMGRAIDRAILSPSPVPYADVEISFSVGVLDLEGLFMLRPSWLIDEYFAIEAFGGISPRQQKDFFVGGLGTTYRLLPGAAFGPYLHAGVGATYIRPKVDNFIDQEELLMALVVGGGFEVTFKKRITLRLDARNWTMFDPNQAFNGLELTGGLAIFF